MPARCLRCSRPLPLDADPRRTTCSNACRQALYRDRVRRNAERGAPPAQSHPERTASTPTDADKAPLRDLFG